MINRKMDKLIDNREIDTEIDSLLSTDFWSYMYLLKISCLTLVWVFTVPECLEILAVACVEVKLLWWLESQESSCFLPVFFDTVVLFLPSSFHFMPHLSRESQLQCHLDSNLKAVLPPQPNMLFNQVMLLTLSFQLQASGTKFDNVVVEWTVQSTGRLTSHMNLSVASQIVFTFYHAWFFPTGTEVTFAST